MLWLLSPNGVFLACWLCLCPIQNRNRCAIVYNFPWERDFGFAYAKFIEPFKETYIARVSCWFSFFSSYFIFRSFFFLFFFSLSLSIGSAFFSVGFYIHVWFMLESPAYLFDLFRIEIQL